MKGNCVTDFLSITQMLETALQADSLSVSELYALREMLTQAIEHQERPARPRLARPIVVEREQFVQDIIKYGLRVSLPVSPEHLRTVGEYLYDSDVLGLSPEEIIAASQERLDEPTNKE